ncbi:ABC transporter permease [Ectothiorhodospiraceae bacterium 2226]|nr:ABC transporter permease [Ectothiorhodospiraceae bacterium 2226]
MNVSYPAPAPHVLQRLGYLRDLMREMVWRDVRVRYKRSVLGIAWTMVNPLLHLLVFYFVFQVILAMDTPRFTSFALTGLLVWGWVTASLAQSAGSITNNATMLRQPGFPPTILPPIILSTHLVYLLFALPVLTVFLIVGGSRPGLGLLTLPLILAVNFVFILALAYFVAAANAYFRDIQHFLDVLLRLSMFLSPVFYEAQRVPEAYQYWYQMNPMVPLLEAYRAVLMYDTRPDWERLAVVFLVSLLVLYFSVRLYRRAAVRKVDEL